MVGIEDRLAEWRRLLRESVPTARAVLDKVLVDRIVFTPTGMDVRRQKDGTEVVKPLGYEFECPTRYDRLFSGVVVPKALWAATIPGAGVIGPEHVYYRAGGRRGLRRGLAPGDG